MWHFPARMRRRAAVGFAIVTALVMFTAACSSDSGGSGGAGNGKTDSVKTDADRALEYRTCLREHGVKAPEPATGEGTVVLGGDSQEMEKAFKACADKVGLEGGDTEISQAEKDTAVKFAQCMRKNGVDMPDPEFKGNAARAMPAPKTGAEAEAFEKASKACETPKP